MLELLEREGALGALPGDAPDVDALWRKLMEREERGSTGLGSGVGYPHVRLEGFADFLLSLAISRAGVQFDSPDGQPVRLMLTAIVSPEKNNLLLGVVACLSRLMSDRPLQERLLDAESSQAAWRVLEEADLEVKESVVASDIMKREFRAVPPGMSLADAAAVMHTERVDALPVLDAGGRLIGEVTARGLFAACLPPYFLDLPTVRFATDFDAFEHFFSEKAHVPVSDILGEQVHAIDPDTPLAEMIARLARGDVLRLYVVAERRLVGVIDSFSIIDKVLSI
ncbi:MAG: hypothetical protein AMK73_07425 [Planctomycetes bacterium SM23_32]|nr:MAG: hypothetical protein AMK73_07425 [Planctomycetes bacterium SM23_32]